MYIICALHCVLTTHTNLLSLPFELSIPPDSGLYVVCTPPL